MYSEEKIEFLVSVIELYAKPLCLWSTPALIGLNDFINGFDSILF